MSLLGAPAKTCVRIETLGIEDAGRVGDPTSIARPCKNPKGVRSLVPAESYEKCLEEELPPQAFHVYVVVYAANAVELAVAAVDD